MRNSCLAAVGASLICLSDLQAQEPNRLEALLRARIAEDTATVAVSFKDLGRPEAVAINAGVRFHAASTMKVPVLLELVRRIDAGELRWSDRLPVRNNFKSIVDGS